MAVVKSNAYGHGVDLVSEAIKDSVDWFATVNLDEALHLRKLGIKKPILVLSYYDLNSVSEAIKQNISLVVYDLKQTQSISKAAKKLKTIANIHLKVDTGTSRLGINPVQVALFIHKILNLPNLKIQGVFSHFAASEEDIEFTKKQNHLFNSAIEELEWRGVHPIKHIACTAAGIVVPNSQHDLVRLGIGLYGLWPSLEAKKRAKFELKPVLSWHTRIIQIKSFSKGSYVGYGMTYQTKRETKLAVLPVGYFDGYDRKLSNSGEVLIAGKRCKLLGRVCMNLIMVDVTDVKKVKVGDEAILIGRQGKEEITADELAKKIGTINYEVVARINSLVERVLR